MLKKINPSICDYKLADKALYWLGEMVIAVILLRLGSRGAPIADMAEK